MKQLFLTLAIAMVGHCSYAQFSSSSGNTTTTDNVGIGTSTPGATLDVKGIIRSTTGGLQIGKFGYASNPALSIGLDQVGFPTTSIINGWGNSSNPGINIGTTRTDGTAFSVVTGVTLDANFTPLTADNYALTVLGNSNVGIGTKTPSAPLEVFQFSDSSVPLRLFGGTNSMVGNKTNMLAFMISDTQNGEKAAAGIEGISSNYNVSGGCLSFLTSNGNVYDPNSLTERMRINADGNVSIGTVDPQGYKLAVSGNAIAESVTVKLHTNWPDYVFKRAYQLPPLSTVKAYIDKNQHLPDMPSEQEVKESGLNLGEIVRVQTKKKEELTIYAIGQQKQIEQLKKKDEARIAKLEAALSKLTANK